MAMRRFELDDLVNRPGTYFNPQTEVLVVVDDSPDLDNEIFDLEEAEGADWVLIDAGDAIVHLFRPEVRSFYNIEKIWSVDSAHQRAAV